MKAVNIRELSHNLSSYLKAVKRGEHLVVMERSSPIADLVPHNKNVQPAWKRPIKRVRIKGESISKTISRMRAEDWR